MMPMGNRIIKDIYEYSITKEFRPKIWSKFVSCLKDNDLLKPHDHLLMLTSANKSSLLLARLFIQLLKHSDFEFDIHFVLFDFGYAKEDLIAAINNFKQLSIPVEVINVDKKIFETQFNMGSFYLKNNIDITQLNELINKYQINKIVTSHHYDDVIEFTMMNMLLKGSFYTINPISQISDKISLIRPMYYIREKDIDNWINYHQLNVISTNKYFTQFNDDYEKKNKTKFLIHELKNKYNIQVEKNIFKATSNVTLDMIMGYIKNDVYYSYLEDYDK